MGGLARLGLALAGARVGCADRAALRRRYARRLALQACGLDAACVAQQHLALVPPLRRLRAAAAAAYLRAGEGAVRGKPLTSAAPALAADRRTAAARVHGYLERKGAGAIQPGRL